MPDGMGTPTGDDAGFLPTISNMTWTAVEITSGGDAANGNVIHMTSPLGANLYLVILAHQVGVKKGESTARQSAVYVERDAVR
jgi:hypothetical protein